MLRNKSKKNQGDFIKAVHPELITVASNSFGGKRAWMAKFLDFTYMSEQALRLFESEESYNKNSYSDPICDKRLWIIAVC